MLDLKNKWVLITGASRGIGKISALFMASLEIKENDNNHDLINETGHHKEND